jgi:hypothetical protein
LISIEPGTALWSHSRHGNCSQARAPRVCGIGVEVVNAPRVLHGVVTGDGRGRVRRDLARRSASAPTDAGLAFAIVPFATVIVFPVLVGVALLYRRQPEDHKRLMRIATQELVTAGVARIPGAGSMPLFFVLTDLGLAAILLYDVLVRGRPHSATVWGGAFLIASQYVRVTAGATAGWIAFARLLAR